RIASFFAGEIETHDAMRPEVDGDFRNFLRNRRIHIAHCTKDQPELDAKRLAARLQSSYYGLHNACVIQSTSDMKHGRESCFHVDDSVRVNVLNHLVCRLLLEKKKKHDTERLRKALKIERQTI